MTAYINTLTGQYPLHEGDIRIEHPYISDKETGDTFVCPAEYALVNFVECPTFDYLTECAYEGAPEQRGNDWFMTWIVRPMTEEEIFLRKEFDKNSSSLSRPGTAPNVI
jgi:hypothetical protein